jgi:hypothetical protein
MLNLNRWKQGDPSKFVVTFFKKRDLKLLIANPARPV